MLFSADESYGGRCMKGEGEACELDPNSVCRNNICECNVFHSPVNGLCKRGRKFVKKSYID